MSNNKRKKNRSWLLIVILVIMAITNPGKDDFVDHLVDETSDGSLMEELYLHAAAELVVETMTEENNYFIFTTYEVHDFSGNSVTYIGLFGFFIEL